MQCIGKTLGNGGWKLKTEEKMLNEIKSKNQNVEFPPLQLLNTSVVNFVRVHENHTHKLSCVVDT